MKLTPNFYRDRVCLNVLAGSKANASAIYEAAEGHVLVGVLSKNYPDVDSAGRDIARTEIKFDEATTGVGTGDLVAKLTQGEYAISFRGYKANEGIIEADVRSVNADQLNIVYRRISEVLGQEKNA